MGIGNFIRNKIFGIGKAVDRQVNERLDNMLRLGVYGNPEIKDSRLTRLQSELLVWSKGNAELLLEFYSTTYSPNPFSNDRQLFWSWVGGANAAKLHYPLPSAIMNQMKALLFATELDISVLVKNDNDDINDKESQKATDKILDIFDENAIYDLFQISTDYETYSGSVAWKPNIDTNISDNVIWEAYPAERIELKTKYGRITDIIFLDFYVKKDKTYTLKSLYGKGYIKYELYDNNGKEVSLKTIDELKDLNDLVFKHNGNTYNEIMAVYKKNRTNSNEFRDSAYGGSDFENITDTFHLVDEIYSTFANYVRKTRPTRAITEDLLPFDDDGRTHKLPKEFGFDTVVLNKTDSANDINKKMVTTIPEPNYEQFFKQIWELSRVAYHKIGLAYTTVGLESVGANQSGNALIQREYGTIIVRDNKIKLWKFFVENIMKVSFLMSKDNIKENIKNDDSADTITFKNIFDNQEYQVEFPEYKGQSIEEKITTMSKALENGLISHREALKFVWGITYDNEELEEMLVDSKIEKGIPLLQKELVGDEDVAIQDDVNDNYEEQETNEEVGA